MRIDLNLLTLFVTVAETANFRIAAERLGVTRSAVSQGVQRLEDALSQPLFQRTTRSVRLTEAGERLLEAVSAPLADIEGALEAALGSAGDPRGLLRVAATSIAERFLSGPLIASFTDAYPGIVLDVTVTDEEFDIVAAGFDAGVRLGEVIEQTFLPYISRGELVRVLDEWLPPFAGFYLYFPSRRTVAPKLRALIDHVRRFRDSGPQA